MTVNSFIPVQTVSRMIDFTPIGREKVIERLSEENKKGVRYSTNCFLQNMPTSLREHLTRLENVLRNSYKFNPKDGIRYNIK